MNKSMQTVNGLLRAIGFALLVALIGGCMTKPHQSVIPLLRQHYEYKDAMRSAPDFTSLAMKAIADLEARQK
jgi:hypothetical protein